VTLRSTVPATWTRMLSSSYLANPESSARNEDTTGGRLRHRYAAVASVTATWLPAGRSRELMVTVTPGSSALELSRIVPSRFPVITCALAAAGHASAPATTSATKRL